MTVAERILGPMSHLGHHGRHEALEIYRDPFARGKKA
jgi:hypothetical protein